MELGEGQPIYEREWENGTPTPPQGDGERMELGEGQPIWEREWENGTPTPPQGDGKRTELGEGEVIEVREWSEEGPQPPKGDGELVELGEGDEFSTQRDAQFYWDRYVSDKTLGMSIDEFTYGWRSVDYQTSLEDIEDAFLEADKMENGSLSFEEFSDFFTKVNSDSGKMNRGPQGHGGERIRREWENGRPQPPQGNNGTRQELGRGQQINSLPPVQEFLGGLDQVIQQEVNRQLQMILASGTCEELQQ